MAVKPSQSKLKRFFDDNRKRVEVEIEAARKYRESHPAPSIVTPKKYLADHPVTKHLKTLGLSATQLNGVSFRKHEGDKFSDWRIIATKTWPPKLFHDMRAWCALRWLILDDPPHSQDTRDAWDLVATYMASLELSAHRAVRKQKASLDKARTAAASGQRRTHGNTKSDQVRRAAENRLLIKPKISRIQLSRDICGEVHLSDSRTLTHLKNLNLPPPRK